MPIPTNELNPINFKKDFRYAKTTPTFVNNNIGVSDEIARWVLDKNAIAYIDEQHAPHLYKKAVKKWTGKKGIGYNPVLIMTDALIYTTDSIIQFAEQRSLPENKFIPEDPDKRKEVLDLYHLFTGEFFEEKVTRYVYTRLIPDKKYARALFKQNVPLKEKLIYKVGYSFMKSALNKDFNLNVNMSNEHLTELRKVFAQVDVLLNDGRKYLTGATLTLADIAFAAIGAPLVLPEEYGGAVSKISEISDEYRKDVNELRATNAGQFILRLYQDDRPMMIPQSEIPKAPGLVKRSIQRMVISSKKKQYKLFYFLQRRYPVLKLPFIKLAFVNRNDLLVELLERDKDFTVEEINSKKMADQKGAFFLGWDKMNPQFDRERNFVRKAVKEGDLKLIQTFVRTTAEKIIKNAAGYGKLDVVESLNKVVFVRLIRYYFGASAPTERIMKLWLRALFYDLFLNFTNNKVKFNLALKAGIERRDYLLQLIKDRKQDLKNGKPLADNMLNRFILMQQEPGNEWFDDEKIQRNIGGIITGILETSSKAVVLVLDELFNRPEILKGAIETAKSGDMKKMYGYVCEGLRFNPAQPGVIRFNETQQILTGKGQKNYTIKAKTKTFALTSAAMFDPAAFPDPKVFNPERDAVYMNYGYALHECYGKYINTVTLSELVAAVLRLKNVRREEGSTGRGTGLAEGPFPHNFVVRFD